MKKVVIGGLFIALAAILVWSMGIPGLTDIPSKPATTSENTDLPTVGSYAKLKTLLRDAGQYTGNRYLTLGGAQGNMAESTKSAPMSPVPSGAADTVQSSYSQTNLQVQGVDEADIVKTDGKYIYQIKGPELVIFEVYPAEQMRVVGRLQFAQDKFTPREIYVDDKHLVLIGSSYYYENPPNQSSAKPSTKPGTSIAPEIYPYPMQGTTTAIVYDLSDKSNLKEVRQVELQGEYLSSRKIGDSLYLAANKYLDYYRIMQEGTEPPAPAYRDTATGQDFINIGYQDIRYFPKSVEPNYLLVAGLNLAKPDQKIQVSTYLGGGQNIYASIDNLYVAVTRYDTQDAKPLEVQPAEGTSAPADRTTGLLAQPPLNVNTVLYKFALDNGNVKYQDKGEVPGTVLNQFSMDEYDGSFRIATTTGEPWRSDLFTSKNNLYVLDNNLKTVGKLEGLAPGEMIHSVRFMGKRAYMVTFRTVDPFYVIDLNNPQAPTVLGYLKIPGYSDYLQPYDETHIIGFGKEAIEAQQPYGGGTMAYYQGMKIAIFDVSDVSHPKEMFKENIGDRGTDSEILHNHKALLFDKEKNLLAFPVMVAEIKNTPQPGEIPYGQFTFQGAYVYNIDLTKGFTLKGKITHFPIEEKTYYPNGWYAGRYNVERILYIDDTLYTVSQEMIKAHSLDTLAEKKSLPTKQ